MSTDQFVIDGICHPYNFSEENLKGRFGRIFDDVLYAFHPLLNLLETASSKDEWQHDWQNDKFLATMFLSPPIAEETGGSYRRQSMEPRRGVGGSGKKMESTPQDERHAAFGETKGVPA